jgi:E3 ubiquitin-protein ligase ZNF598
MSVIDEKSTFRQSLSEGEIATLSDGHSHCLVCYSDLTVRGKTPCSHDDICGVCHLRLRFLHDDKKCPICKQTNNTVVVDKDGHGKRFDDYPRWGDDIGAGFVYRDDVGMFFEENYFYQDITPLFAYACNKCDFKVDGATNNITKKNSPQRMLEDHLKHEHRLSICRLCIEHKRDFVARLPQMTHNQLQNHLKNGDGPDSGFSGHPICEFCRPRRFYDLNFLHQHLHKEHYKCDICAKQGLDNQWFRDYQSLEKHFDKKHFLCHDVQCLCARFIVFENELDLRAHELSTHGGTSTGSTKIQLEFRTRRAGYDGSGMDDQQSAPSQSDFNYDLDGQAFVPESLPRQRSTTRNVANNATLSNTNVQLHPLHVQRTEELRAHAAAVRQRQAVESQEELFPTLQSSAAAVASSAPLVGWTTGAALQKVNRNYASVGMVTTEAFPALPSSDAAGANAQRKAIKGSIGSVRRQFAAISTSVPSHVTTRPSNMAPSSSISTSNRESNLAPDNFPALGHHAGARPAPYASSNTVAKNNLKPAPPYAKSVGDIRTGSSHAMNPNPAAVQAPSLDSVIDFPAPPSAALSKERDLRRQMLGDTKPQARSDNILQVDMATSAVAKATVEEMKATLGQKKYKELKRLTKEFASDQLSPEGFVDHSAALFDRGYADVDFWSYLSSLLESCPNEVASQHAMRYMTSLRQQMYGEASQSARLARNPPAPSSQWKGSTANSTIISSSAVPPFNEPAGRLIQSLPVTRANNVASKQKSAWGVGGSSTIVRTKALPESVAGHKSSQLPLTSNTTKSMTKGQMKAPSSTNISNGKKKKQKDELRALAFGR